jgi:polysaccharide deacetylase family protein (PEP-CTERM system associated)
MTPLNALTFDVEEYFQVTGFAREIDPATWPLYESRVGPSTRLILDRLDEADVRATFFVLGCVARRHPALVRQIQRAGHEVASHGEWHRLVTTQTPAEFRADVRSAKAVLEDLTGEPVVGYRAPSFSITPDRDWAFEVLVEEGYGYDSSVAAGRRDSCGDRAGDGCPFVMPTPSGSLMEYPMPTARWLGRHVPVGGGGYFRLYPYALTRHALRGLNAAGKPFAVYLHPWEFDPNQPLLEGPLPRRLKHYVNLRRTLPRFEQLLEEFRFDSMAASMSAFFDDRVPVRQERPVRAAA